jgi:hypothetical protein
MKLENFIVVLVTLPPLVCQGQAVQSPPNGDIYMSGTNSAPTPLQAFIQLDAVAQEVTSAPGTDYQAGQPDFPKPTQIQAQWDQAMSSDGNALTPGQRQEILPCVPHLNAAIDDMERGWRIQVSQANNSAAQQTAQKLYAAAKAEMVLCAGLDKYANQQDQQPANAPPPAPGPPAAPAPIEQPPVTGGQPNPEPLPAQPPPPASVPVPMPAPPTQRPPVASGPAPSRPARPPIVPMPAPQPAQPPPTTPVTPPPATPAPPPAQLPPSLTFVSDDGKNTTYKAENGKLWQFPDTTSNPFGPCKLLRNPRPKIARNGNMVAGYASYECSQSMEGSPVQRVISVLQTGRMM